MSDHFDHTLERKLESKDGDAVADVRRFEVITGTGRRRRWSTDDKARILLESFTPGANVSEVARRNGLSPQQLFSWRREFRDFDASTPAALTRPGDSKSPSSETKPAAMTFAPIVVAAASPPPPPPSGPGAPGIIEIVIGDMVVRVLSQVETATLAAVLRAVRRAS